MALLRDGQPIAEYSWLAAGRHTAQLIPALDMLCHAAQAPLETWSAVAVAVGPGSFNGIRAGIAAALGLAVSRQLPLVGMSTLDILAYQAHLGRGEDGRALICAALPAGRGELYYALYAPERAAGKPDPWAEAARAVGPEIGLPKDLAAALRGQGAAGAMPLICGTLPPALAEAMERALGMALRWLGPAATLRRATYLALLARQYLEAGGVDQTESVRPLYLRRVTVTQSRRPFPLTAGGA